MADLFDMKVGGLGFHITSHLIALVALFVACFAITGYITFRDDSIPPKALETDQSADDDLKVNDIAASGNVGVTGDLTVSGIIDKNYVSYDFNGTTVTQNLQNDNSAASGVAAEINRTTLANGARFYIQNIGTQTLLAPVVDGVGLDFAGDLADNEGKQGIVLAKETDSATTSHPYLGGRDFSIDTRFRSFTVGTSPAFYCSFTVEIDDVSGTDDCAFGFREVENFQAALDDYTDLSCLNVISGNINIETIKAGAATVSTDTTVDFADTEVHTLTVFVSATGVVTYLIDGVAPTTTAAYTFATGTVVSPFFYILNATTTPAPVVIRKLEYGLQ